MGRLLAWVERGGRTILNDGRPTFTRGSKKAAQTGRVATAPDITIAPSVDYLERAYDDAKYGSFSKRPFCDIVIPSLTDPSVAPPGKHVMSVFVQYAPYHLKEGPEDWPNQREAFGDAVIDTIASPGSTTALSIPGHA